MSTNLKTSLLVNRQVPEFVREEYPLFITFLEAYYEFLETKQQNQINDLTNKAKELRYLSDVDYSINEFETQFFNTFASLIPKNIQVDKEFLIKNILPLYLAKGSEASFKLLFRMLFNDEIKITYPKDNILRVSDGKWVVDNILKIETDIRSVYTGDGQTTTFYLGGCKCPIRNIALPIQVTVFFDGVEVSSGYEIRQETKKIIFDVAPSNNVLIEIFYRNFDITLLNNRKITGLTSGATAIIERATPRIITDKLNLGLPYELFISSKTSVGSFINGEKVATNIFHQNGTLIDIQADTFSVLTRINVINGGTGYNVADPVIIIGGGATIPATAEVESISDGFTSGLLIKTKGAGFKVGSIIRSLPTVSTTITGAVNQVDLTETNTSNTYTVLSGDVILAYANVNISDPDYGFPKPSAENVNSRIIDALSPVIVTEIGPIANVVLLFSNTTINTTALDSEGALYQTDANTFFDIKNFKSIGKIDVLNGGLNYKVGDEIIFGTNPSGTYGINAAATVKKIEANGKIISIQIEPPRIEGKANVQNNSTSVQGISTFFENDLRIGDKIVIRSQEKFIDNIMSNTSLTVNTAFSFTDGTNYSNNNFIGSFAKGPVGGINYTQNNFPTITILSQSGTNAVAKIISLMGDGEIIEAVSNSAPGAIRSIKITNAGSGYQYLPQIDLSQSGDGNASADDVIGKSFLSLPGRWVTSDSIISSSDRVFEGQNYFIDFSFVSSSFTDFVKYKELLKNLLKPAGFINYGILNKEKTANAHISNVISISSNTISGIVNVTSGTIYITGLGTKFNVANSRGIFTIGSNVSVNNQIRTISNIISNTNIAVSSAFTMNANSQTLIILT